VAPVREPLTMEDREDISCGLAKGLCNKDIAFSIGRDELVASREIARHRRARGVSCVEGRRGRTRIAEPPEGA
jgi:transposase, IS30 family